MATTVSVMRAIHLSSRIVKSAINKHSYACSFRLSTQATNENTSEQEKEAADKKKEISEEAKKHDELASQVKKLEEDLKESKLEEKKQVSKLQEDLRISTDKFLRSLAESENLRKRMTKQVDDAKLFGIQSFCKDLLEVSDILSTAITAVPKEELNESNPHLVNLYNGLNMTESQLLKVFKKHGLESISPQEGEKFNPHIHEALFQVPVQEKEKQSTDTVAVVQKIGFKLHDRTLRPALVGVFK